MNWFYCFLGGLAGLVGFFIHAGLPACASTAFCYLLICICAKLDATQKKYFGGAK